MITLRRLNIEIALQNLESSHLHYLYIHQPPCTVSLVAYRHPNPLFCLLLPAVPPGLFKHDFPNLWVEYYIWQLTTLFRLERATVMANHESDSELINFEHTSTNKEC